MTSSRAVTRRAALAAFLLFAAGLFVVGPAEASRTTTDARAHLAASSHELSLLDLVEPTAPVESPSRFGFAEDFGLLDPEAGPGGFVLFARETSRCELTYARNNPLRFVDPDGREAGSVTNSGEWGMHPGGPLPLRQEAALWAGVVGSGVVGYGLFQGGATMGPAILSWLLTPQGNQQAQMLTEALAGPPGPSTLSSVESIAAVVKPGGAKIGVELGASNIRGVVGTLEDAAGLFGSIRGSAAAVPKEGGRVLVAEAKAGAQLILRTKSSTAGTTATIQFVGTPGLGIKEIKYFKTAEDLANAAGKK